MPKPARHYVCQECGSVHPRWTGRCGSCEAWNSVIEESPEISAPNTRGGSEGRIIPFVPLSGTLDWSPRNASGITEFDRVLGGGLVPGSAILVGGDPGIGKSTVLLQVVAKLAEQVECVYVSGEEALDQVRMRAVRLGIEKAPARLAVATNVRDILASVDTHDAPQILVIDSIQTMYVDALGSAPGTVSQVRASAQELIRVAKKRGIVLLLVGHVTKEGTIAGPRVLEHMVDTVLYFEGERGHQFRILRSVKNRFGPTDEIGVFEMTERGLAEVTNPSSLFLGERRDDISGACVFGGMEGTRPLLVEIQALVAPSPFGTPRRAVIGWDSSRLAMVTAVLEARCGVSFANSDVFLNVAGGLKINEPAADLAVATALLSSFSGTPAPTDSVIFGEIGLSAEARAVSHTDARLKEAAKLGFGRAIIPSIGQSKIKSQPKLGLQIKGISNLQELVNMFKDDTNSGRRAM
ncbi:MAG: DNA repair protein RadA [Rhodospirillaceae bacterium]|nr:DNA repair protein RadA [Rhodospirillaceae bacterium]